METTHVLVGEIKSIKGICQAAWPKPKNVLTAQDDAVRWVFKNKCKYAVIVWITNVREYAKNHKGPAKDPFKKKAKITVVEPAKTGAITTRLKASASGEYEYDICVYRTDTGAKKCIQKPQNGADVEVYD